MNLLTQTLPLSHITAPAVTTQLAYKEIVIIAKVYTNKQKYNRFISFNYKLTIFYNIYKRSSLSYKRYTIVFPTILKYWQRTIIIIVT
jgi:hypothetical protein